MLRLPRIALAMRGSFYFSNFAGVAVREFSDPAVRIFAVVDELGF